MKQKQEGVFKMLNEAIEKVNLEQFMVLESWRKTKVRLQEQYPTAKIKYSYKTRQFKVLFEPPKNALKVGEIYSISNG